MQIEAKIQLQQRLKYDARQRIKDRINESMGKKSNNFKTKTKQKKIKVISIRLTNKNTRTFDTMYLTIILKLTLIRNNSIILKLKNSITLKTVHR